jgi:hypothetical protein
MFSLIPSVLFCYKYAVFQKLVLIPSSGKCHDFVAYYSNSIRYQATGSGFHNCIILLDKWRGTAAWCCVFKQNIIRWKVTVTLSTQYYVIIVWYFFPIFLLFTILLSFLFYLLSFSLCCLYNWSICCWVSTKSNKSWTKSNNSNKTNYSWSFSCNF